MEKRLRVDSIQSVVYVIPLQTHKKQMVYGPRMPCYELVYKISGESVTQYNGKELHNLPGTVEFLPKCEKAEYYVDRVVFGDCIDIHFCTDQTMPNEAFRVDCRNNPRVEALFRRLYHLWVAQQDEDQYRCLSLLYEIFYELTKCSPDYLPKERCQKISPGVAYLQEHAFDREVDYYEPANICNICYTYFKQLFLKQFGMTPIKYVTALRMKRGAELLQSGQYRVSEVAQLCGYESLYYFSRKFKAVYGVPPSAYRQ